LHDLIKNAKKITFFTGAGISAESGIQAYRDSDGLWNKVDSGKYSSLEGFLDDPENVSAWYDFRKNIIDNAEPNLAHTLIAELSKTKNVTVITQNIDCLHHRAGSKNVIELHGNIKKHYCASCHKPYESLGRCFCGGYIRPGVVWFGEATDEAVFSAAYEAANCDVLVVVGTSGIVWPAAHIPVYAKDMFAKVIVIDPKDTEFDYFADLVIRDTAVNGINDLINN